MSILMGLRANPGLGAHRSCFDFDWVAKAGLELVKAKADWKSGWLALEQGERPLARGNGQMISVQCSVLSRLLTCVLRARLPLGSRLSGQIWDLSLLGRIKWSSRSDRSHRGVLCRCWLVSSMQMFNSIDQPFFDWWVRQKQPAGARTNSSDLGYRLVSMERWSLSLYLKKRGRTQHLRMQLNWISEKSESLCLCLLGLLQHVIIDWVP